MSDDPSKTSYLGFWRLARPCILLASMQDQSYALKVSLIRGLLRRCRIWILLGPVKAHLRPIFGSLKHSLRKVTKMGLVAPFPMTRHGTIVLN